MPLLPEARGWMDRGTVRCQRQSARFSSPGFTHFERWEDRRIRRCEGKGMPLGELRQTAGARTAVSACADAPSALADLRAELEPGPEDLCLLFADAGMSARSIEQGLAESWGDRVVHGATSPQVLGGSPRRAEPGRSAATAGRGLPLPRAADRRSPALRTTGLVPSGQGGCRGRASAAGKSRRASDPCGPHPRWSLA